MDTSKSHKRRGWFSRTPAMAAFARLEGRTSRGTVRWLLTPGELRYLVALAAFANEEAFVKASQGVVADYLGVNRRLAGKWEASLVRKGFAETILVRPGRGKWKVRIVRLIYPSKGPDAPNQVEVGRA